MTETRISLSQGIVLLSGVVGSTAYGLNTENSDVDHLGVYAAPTIRFHGLHPPIGREATVVHKDPDASRTVRLRLDLEGVRLSEAPTVGRDTLASVGTKGAGRGVYAFIRLA